jgi:hypothetical protein
LLPTFLYHAVHGRVQRQPAEQQPHGVTGC